MIKITINQREFYPDESIAKKVFEERKKHEEDCSEAKYVELPNEDGVVSKMKVFEVKFIDLSLKNQEVSMQWDLFINFDSQNMHDFWKENGFSDAQIAEWKKMNTSDDYAQVFFNDLLDNHNEYSIYLSNKCTINGDSEKLLIEISCPEHQEKIQDYFGNDEYLPREVIIDISAV